MASSTTNYNLIKPDYEDDADIKDLNDNFDTIDTAMNNKVDKEIGKGLSTNDYTTAEKTKLAGIAEGAEVNEIEGIKVNNTSVNPDANKVVNITVPTTAADVSALPDTTKYAVALSLTINSSTFVMTGQLKDQNGDNLGTAQTIDLPLESVVVGGSYNSQTKKVVLTLQNGNTIEFSVADLVSGLQTELSTSNKLNPAFIEYDSTHRAVSDTEKSTWNSKQNALTTAQLAAVNSGIDSTKVAQIETNKNNISKLDQKTISPATVDNKKVFTIPINAHAALIPICVGGDSTMSDSALLAFNSLYDTKSVKIIDNITSASVSAVESAVYDNGNIVVTMAGNKAYKAIYRIL